MPNLVDPQLSDAGFLRSVLAASDDCIKVLDLDANLVFMSEGGQRVMEVSDFNAIAGCPWPNFWHGQGHADAKAAVAAARAGGSGRFQGIASTMAGNSRYWDVQVTAIPGPDGRPERLLSVSRDITATRQAEMLLAKSQERLNLALGAASMIGTWDWDLSEGLVYADANFARLHAVDPAAAARGAGRAEYVKNVHPGDMPLFEAELGRAFDGAPEFSCEYRILQPDGSVRWLLARGAIIRDDAGKPLRFCGASVDITDRRLAEEQRAELAREMAHRLKNSLAMVQSIVTQTLRQSKTVEEAGDAIAGRISALAKAQDILTQTSWASADIRDILASSLAPHRGGDNRITMAGPKVDLSAQQGLGLSLALNELATNAAKYGSLSNEDGRVAIEWSASPDGAFAFAWTETGGPEVRKPAALGFGSKLLVRMVAPYFSGTASLDHEPAGVRFRLTGDVAASGISKHA